MKKQDRENLKLNIVDSLILFFWIVYLFIKLWIIDGENIGTSFLGVFCFTVPSTGTVLAILACVVISFVIIINDLKVDENFLLFLIRIPLYLIPILYIDQGTFKFGIAFTVIQMFVAYYLGYNFRGKINFIIYALIGASIILVLQEFYVLYDKNISIFSVADLKYWMRLPGGKTNTLGTFIVSIYVLISEFYSKNKSPLKYMYLAFLWVGLFATGTRSGILVLLIYYIVKIGIFLLRGEILKNLNKKQVLGTLIASALFLLLGGIIILNSDGIMARLKYFTLEGMSSSRFKVYADMFSYILEYPLLGRSAFSYQAYDAVRAHNTILESLVETGIIGTIIYFAIWFNCYKKIRKIKDDQVRRSFKAFILITLLHGMVEPNVWTISSDTFVWFLIGVAASRFPMENPKKMIRIGESDSDE